MDTNSGRWGVSGAVREHSAPGMMEEKGLVTHTQRPDKGASILPCARGRGDPATTTTAVPSHTFPRAAVVCGWSVCDKTASSDGAVSCGLWLWATSNQLPRVACERTCRQENLRCETQKQKAGGSGNWQLATNHNNLPSSRYRDDADRSLPTKQDKRRRARLAFHESSPSRL